MLVQGGIPAGGERDEDAFLTKSSFDTTVGLWRAPFGMEKINARVVRKSAGCLNYGAAFNFQELSLVPDEKSAKKHEKTALHPTPPEVVQKMIDAGRLPKPGMGPTPELRAKTRFLSVLVAEADGSDVTSTVAISGGEAGYEDTAKMVVEAALALVLNNASCPGFSCGGFQTPAMCLGNALIHRLQHADIKFTRFDTLSAAIEAFHSGALAQDASPTLARL
eukprot:m.479175 g.479175  ORF g.479175 m.479175 type:complete len:221 (+) comp21697_c0_seq8:88-750(+)